MVWYKAFINGAYYGVALHLVSEPSNESYEYASSADLNQEGESSGETKFKISESEDEIILNNDLNTRDQMHSMQNPESSNEPFPGTSKKKQTYSQRNQKNVNKLNTYDKKSGGSLSDIITK